MTTSSTASSSSGSSGSSSSSGAGATSGSGSSTAGSTSSGSSGSGSTGTCVAAAIGPFTAPTSFEDFCQQAGPALCSQFAACGDCAVANSPACAELAAQQFFACSPSTAVRLDAGAVVADLVAAATCLDSIGVDGCTASGRPRLDDACNQLLQAATPEGGACSDDWMCALPDSGWLFTAGGTPGCDLGCGNPRGPQVCSRGRVAGEPCSFNSGQGCLDGDCLSSAAGGLVCVAAQGLDGGPCEPDVRNCDRRQAFCDVRPDAGGQICEPFVGLGGPCRLQDCQSVNEPLPPTCECAPGQYCNAVGAPDGTCATLLPPFSECDPTASAWPCDDDGIPTSCGRDDYPDGGPHGICPGRRQVDGGPCNDQVGATCAPDLFCSGNGTCVPSGGLGSPCASDVQCVLGLGCNGICVAPAGPGERANAAGCDFVSFPDPGGTCLALLGLGSPCDLGSPWLCGDGVCEVGSDGGGVCVAGLFHEQPCTPTQVGSPCAELEFCEAVEDGGSVCLAQCPVRP